MTGSLPVMPHAVTLIRSATLSGIAEYARRPSCGAAIHPHDSGNFREKSLLRESHDREDFASREDLWHLCDAKFT
jgi:hypothetical protein